MSDTTNDISDAARGSAQCAALVTAMTFGITLVLASWIDGSSAAFVFQACGFFTAMIAGALLGPRMNADLERSRTMGRPTLEAGTELAEYPKTE